ncbi:hypothetical protein F2P81_021831 [Scophthalmus maximus]|uniref:Uncharacterized protein n=1 Tax=Scophthalmus maximus TaxID=52904 RepID=A0A6A4S001_SCOMX|nr:hypothetical protein F2P81_021831 [Scophthalmus maximus]
MDKIACRSGVPDLLNIAHLKEFENVFPYMSSLYADGHKVESYCGLYNMKLTTLEGCECATLKIMILTTTRVLKQEQPSPVAPDSTPMWTWMNEKLHRHPVILTVSHHFLNHFTTGRNASAVTESWFQVHLRPNMKVSKREDQTS